MSKTIQFSADIIEKMLKIYNNLDNELEYEIMFGNFTSSNALSFNNYLNVLKYVSYLHKINNYKLETYDTLDVVYKSNPDLFENYRITIHGLDKINNIMESVHRKKNHLIFSLLSTMDNDKLTLIKKMRIVDSTFNIPNYDIRVRLSSEKDVPSDERAVISKLDETVRHLITFRFKQRSSLFIVDNDDVTIRIDVTMTKTTNNADKLESVSPKYELELEIIKKHDKLKKLDKKYFDIMMDYITKLTQIIQQSPHIINNDDKNIVLNRYTELINPKSNSIKLYGRNSVSLEIEHVQTKLPNKYCVTDKADGERYFLIILNNKVFLISNNLDVKFTGIKLESDKYNNTILDGEFIHLSKYNKSLLMVFDALYYCGKDIRGLANYADRIGKADDVIKNCFNNKHVFEQYTGKFNIDNIIKFHAEQIDNYFLELNNNVQNNDHILVRRKYMIFPLGGNDNEIFVYSKFMWDKYVLDSKCPYVLDGLIYEPLEQIYTRLDAKTKYIEYKWKPENKNSIDFYIEFEKDDNGQIVTLFDLSNTVGSNNDKQKKLYRICQLYVGKFIQGSEKPVLFQRDTNNYLAYLYVEDGDVRDLDKKVIQDKTVVEFYYNNDLLVDPKFRWVPIKTRLDKTESVIRYKKGYGNYVDTANAVWQSIVGPFTMNDIRVLADTRTYSKHLQNLNKKQKLVINSSENVYYQKVSNLAKPLRKFHNWIKNNIISSYCSNQQKVIDFGCGRGGDIDKFNELHVELYVGLDVDNNGLENGAIIRYAELLNKSKNVSKMYFINANVGARLTVQDQIKVIGNNMSSKNIELLKQFFDEPNKIKYDVINCQFMIHYLFESDVTFNNLISNINDCLKDGGIMLVTCFDAEQVMKLLDGQEQKAIHYTNNIGEQIKFMEIIKRFDNEQMELGCGIDVYNSMISNEGVYNMEYLVDKTFFIQQMLEHCELEIVETELFETVYHKNKSMFKNDPKYKFISKYYDMNDPVNVASFEMTKLNRYYVFRKKESNKKQSNETKKQLNETNKKTNETNKKQPNKTNKSNKNETNKKQKGGEYRLDYLKPLLNSSKFVRLDNDETNYSFIKSIETVVDMDSKYDECLEVNKVQDKNIKLDNVVKGLNVFVLMEDGFNTIIESSPFDKNINSILLYKQDNKYYPILKNNNGEYKGVFNSNQQFIQNLVGQCGMENEFEFV